MASSEVECYIYFMSDEAANDIYIFFLSTGEIKTDNSFYNCLPASVMLLFISTILKTKSVGA